MAANLPSPNLNFRAFSLCLPRLRPSIKKVPVSPSPCKSSFSAPSSVIFPSSVNKEAAHVNCGGCGANESRLSLVWKEVQGVNNWENLIQPLDPLLRDEVIRYAEFLSACYKAFDLQPDSKRYLKCKFGKRNLLSEVGLGGSGYEVTKYIYGTPDIKVPIQTLTLCSRWMGYIAVSNDNETKTLGRRDVLITFRGTVTIPEWIANFMSTLAPARFDPHNPRPEVMVETGFLNLYTSKETKSKFGPPSCREQLLSEVSRLIEKYKGEEISITLAGHSMGSSLAVLLAYDIAELGINEVRDDTEIPITVFSFGGPRVGNPGFKERCEELGVKVLRIVNTNDPITKLPGVVFNEGFKVFADKYGFPWKYFSSYAHVGVELGLNFFEMHNPTCVHDLEDYILSLHKFPMDTQLASQRDFNNFYFLGKTKQFLYLVRILYWLWANGAIKMVEFLSLIIYVCIYVYRYS